MRIILLLVLGSLVAAAAPSGAEEAPLFPFFAFCIDTHDSMNRTLEEQAALLKELGYDGVGHLWLDEVRERLGTLEDAGLRLFQITLRVDITSEEAPYDPRLAEVLPLLSGKKVQLCLLMTGMAPSDESGDERAVRIVRDMADQARESGTEIILYPHVNDWLERVEDAVRLARKVDRPNVGVMFNLCHWLKVDREDNLEPLLALAMPWLRAVSINGADRADAIRDGTGDWLQPLDSGSFDVYAVLRALRAQGYAGPVGLQCWGIGGDARDHLTRSMGAWQALQNRLRQSASVE